MHFVIPVEIDGLEKYIPQFLALIGEDRWFKRASQLDADRRKSPFREKIVLDYHWLEMAISFQAEVLAKEGRLLPELMNELIFAALNFTATTVEVHSRLSTQGRTTLEGRLRDGLKADTGYASLYLELDLAQRLMGDGYNVEFVDMEGAAQFDLLFGQGGFVGEVECKSLSADAGRQIHRKDFYRFMESIVPAMGAHVDLRRKEVLMISLRSRLFPNTSDQVELQRATTSMLREGAPDVLEGVNFKLERWPYSKVLAISPARDSKAFDEACRAAFGQDSHVAGALAEDGGCLVVMRSERKDDTSKPMLEAMRKAASQFSGKRPSFIAIQEHGIGVEDLMLPNLHRQAGILSYALFGHYGAAHINAVYVTGFGAVVLSEGKLGTPAFSIPNPRPAFPIATSHAVPFFIDITDADYVAPIVTPLPSPNVD